MLTWWWHADEGCGMLGDGHTRCSLFVSSVSLLVPSTPYRRERKVAWVEPGHVYVWCTTASAISRVDLGFGKAALP